MITVALLYVSRKGPYWGCPDADVWDEERDARRYRYRSEACPPGIKICSSGQRMRTPPAFAAWLIDLATSPV